MRREETIGTETLVFDSQNDDMPYFLGNPVPMFWSSEGLGLRVDDAWYLMEFEGEPIRDECGRPKQVARFEIGDDCQYTLLPTQGVGGFVEKTRIRPPDEE